ncbi:hypothetical protein CHLRE_05g238950v5 [Chlamydomonas reinhardtii]|uniref:tRNA/rRNA methyltransferase SpoU type domain-containing protein n=1 Tax=Chlamydomonas reinhardtii TaxID=3055 RepID=A0A2K3DT38_CHLRE|nr:uncharacterized protein CHLRE_05g238950v5 [Chlamydomonas reinhardtii]PNW83678.1 hypothetical protein CHLRE_05g238950v5 [Chlamydomonas reinhardtii]
MEPSQASNDNERVAEAGSSAAEAPSTSGPASYIITHSVSKRHNIGTIVRSATAFGVKEVCLVGSRQFNTFGSHGSDAHVAFRHFDTLAKCVQHLKEVEGCRVLGVEICEGALPVQEHPFTGPTAFLLGNEGQGMTDRQMALCDGFVYIPQHGAGTASLNVAVAASIVLHHFAIWAAYPERQREGYKFVVAEKPQRTTARGVVRESDDVVRQQRQQRRQEAAAADEAGGGGFAAGGLFDDEDGEEGAEAGDGEAGEASSGEGES